MANQVLFIHQDYQNWEEYGRVVLYIDAVQILNCNYIYIKRHVME